MPVVGQCDLSVGVGRGGNGFDGAFDAGHHDRWRRGDGAYFPARIRHDPDGMFFGHPDCCHLRAVARCRRGISIGRSQRHATERVARGRGRGGRLFVGSRLCAAGRGDSLRGYRQDLHRHDNGHGDTDRTGGTGRDESRQSGPVSDAGDGAGRLWGDDSRRLV